MSTSVNLSKPNRRINIGVILMGGTTELLDIAVVDLLQGIAKTTIDEFPDLGNITPEMRGQAIDMDIHWVSAGGPSVPAKLTSGVTVNPTHSFETCPPLDIALIGAHDFGYMPTAEELDYVRATHDVCAAFLFVCGGLTVGLGAGLLEGRTATGPRIMLPMLMGQAKGTTWVDKRWVRDGKIWTTGTLLNGADMMAAFMGEVWGGEATLVEQVLRMVGVPRRDVNYKDVEWEV